MTVPLFNMLACFLWVGLFVSLSQGQMFTRGQKFQIILSGKPDMTKSPLPPIDAPVWDIDLFDNEASIIAGLKAQGKIVICYFSAGTWEDWRDDAREFPEADKGKVLPEWPNEKWIRTGSAKVRDIMAKRIKIAADKGCDALDPDNTDGYQNDNGLNLKSADLIDYMNFLQKSAAQYGMKIGLKNSLDIIPAVSGIMDFAVNEQCAQLNECTAYNEFLRSGKPVFQIEYPSRFPVPDQERRQMCGGPGTEGMSTVLKNLTLSGYTMYCDGRIVDTPTVGGNPGRPPIPPRSSTTRRPPPSSTPPFPTPRNTTTSSSTRTSSTPPITRSSTRSSSTSSSRPPITSTPRSTSRSSTTSSAKPTSSAGGGGGCRQKHWDQCGGNDWKGCTTCESPYTCKGVSAPWYYQCL